MSDIVKGLDELAKAMGDVLIFYKKVCELFLDLRALKDDRVETLFAKYDIVIKEENDEG